MQYKHHHLYIQCAFIAELRLSHVLVTWFSHIPGILDETLNAAHTVFFVPQYTSILPAVAEACVAATADRERGRLKGAQVLEILHERSHFGAPDVGNMRHAALNLKSVCR